MKANKATIMARVEEILRIRLDGAELWDVRQYVAEKVKAGEEPWKLDEGECVSDRQLYRYMAQADQQIAESLKTTRKKAVNEHIAKRRSLYARAVSQGDLRTALSILRDEAELRDLYPDKEDEMRRELDELRKLVAQIGSKDGGHVEVGTQGGDTPTQGGG